VTGDHPAGRTVEAGFRIDHDETLAVARQLPWRVDVAPAFGQVEAQAGAGIGVAGHAHAGAGEQVVAADDGPGGGDARVVATIAPALVDAVAPAQLAAFFRRRPDQPVIDALDVAIAFNGGVAVFGHGEIQAAG